MEKTYHILSVYDYKGGKLGADLNLTYQELIHSLVETLRLYNYIYEFESDDETIDEDVVNEAKLLREGLSTGEFSKWIKNQRSIYAGGDGSCFELFECEDNTMTEFDLTDVMLSEIVEDYIRYIENPEEWN
jgi:hypothetical protein